MVRCKVRHIQQYHINHYNIPVEVRQSFPGKRRPGTALFGRETEERRKRVERITRTTGGRGGENKGGVRTGAERKRRECRRWIGIGEEEKGRRSRSVAKK